MLDYCAELTVGCLQLKVEFIDILLDYEAFATFTINRFVNSAGITFACLKQTFELQYNLTQLYQWSTAYQADHFFDMSDYKMSSIKTKITWPENALPRCRTEHLWAAGLGGIQIHTARFFQTGNPGWWVKSRLWLELTTVHCKSQSVERHPTCPRGLQEEDRGQHASRGAELFSSHPLPFLACCPLDGASDQSRQLLTQSPIADNQGSILIVSNGWPGRRNMCIEHVVTDLLVCSLHMLCTLCTTLKSLHSRS